MRSFLLIALLCCTAAFHSYAQTGTVQGTIRSSDGKPAGFVNVGLKGTNKGAAADSTGNYTINDVTPGSYILVTRFVGLKPQEVQIEVTANQVTLVPEIILAEDERTLKEVVITANRNRYNENSPSPSLRVTTPILQLPQNIQVVTNDVLRDQQAISMSDGVMRNVSGLNRFEHWGDMYVNIQSRGSQVQAFRNGFNIVNSSWGPLTEDMCFVDHIEFVKGPAGFMLSSGAPAGLYNTVTKRPTGFNTGEASATIGSFGLFRTTLDLNGRLSKDGRWLYRFNMAAQTKKSHRVNEYNDRYAIAPVIAYRLDERTVLTFEYNYQRANMSNVGSYYIFSPSGYGTYDRNLSVLPAGLEGTTINDHSFYFNFVHDFNRDWKVTAQLAKFYYNQVGSSMWAGVVDSATGKWIRNVGIWDAQSRMNMGQVFLNGKFTTGPLVHNVLTGIDAANKGYIADWGQSFDLDSAGAEFDPHNPYLGVPVMGFPQYDRETPLAERAQAAGGLMALRYTSAYVQDEISFLDNRVRVTLAGRYTFLVQDNWGAKPDTASTFTPRAGVSVSVTKNMAVYALYDQAFIPQSGRLANGGKVLPITGSIMELGVKNAWFDGKWNSTVSVYQIVNRNELTPDPNSPPTSGLSVVVGEKTNKGVEFDLRGNIVRGLDLILNYAYTDSRVTSVAEGVTTMKVGDLIPGNARHTANAWITYKLPVNAINGLGVSLGGTYLKDRTSLGDAYWGDATKQRMNDYMKVDAGLFWEHQNMRITMNVFNVLDEYLYSGVYYVWSSAYYYQTEAPRNFRLSVNYRF
jgi:iron complex outermembrane receptor protein